MRDERLSATGLPRASRAGVNLARAVSSRQVVLSRVADPLDRVIRCLQQQSGAVQPLPEQPGLAAAAGARPELPRERPPGPRLAAGSF